MKNEEWTVKCKTYLDTIYWLALKKYNEISTIRSYIDQGDDRTQIKTAIDKFELALFDKYYDILREPMEMYYSDLQNEYLNMINQDASLRSSDYSLRISQIQQQMWNVSRVLNAKNLDEIMSVVSSYIYLKKQIEWK